MTTKATMRREIRARVTELPERARETESSAVCAALADNGDVRTANTLMAYLALPDEANVDALIRSVLDDGRRVCVPRIDWSTRTLDIVAIDDLSDLDVDACGIRTPGPDAATVPIAEVNTIVVPGIAFDREGGRLGRGGGFYDRLLAQRTPSTRAIGVCFACQVVDAVPREAHDVPMNTVLTGN